MFYVDSHCMIREISCAHTARPADGLSRYEVADERLWPASLLPYKSAVEAALRGERAHLTPELWDVIRFLESIGVLRVRKSGEG